MEKMNKSPIEILEAGSLREETVNELLQETAATVPCLTRLATHVGLAAKLSAKATCICVRNPFGKLLGALFCYCNDDMGHCAYITFISILDACRSFCTGRDIHNAFLEYAKSRGMKKSMLEVNKPNTVALKFYERAGYKIIEDRGRKWLMSLTLDNGEVTDAVGILSRDKR